MLPQQSKVFHRQASHPNLVSVRRRMGDRVKDGLAQKVWQIPPAPKVGPSETLSGIHRQRVECVRFMDRSGYRDGDGIPAL